MCRKLNCNKTYFRNKPHLKKIILSEKRKIQEKIISNLPNNGNYEDLTSIAKKFEPIYIKYKNDMENQGKNWRMGNTKTLSEKLKIPYDILIEIKLKYCPNTRKIVRKQILKIILKENVGNEKTEK